MHSKSLPPAWVSIVVGAACLLALADWPYGYYQILRLAVTAYAVWLAACYADERASLWVWIFSVLAVLYNPIFKISMTRDLHGIINVITAALIFGAMFARRRV